MMKIQLIALLAVLLGVSACTHNASKVSNGNDEFDRLAELAQEKNDRMVKVGYAWTSAGIKSQYDKATEAGKAFAATGRKLTLVDTALFEGETLIKKGDINKGIAKAKLANELADAQIAQQQTSQNYQKLWR